MLPLAESSAERVEVFAGTHAYACQRVQRPAWAWEFGRDRYGVYLKVTIAGVVQRQRWLGPGEFRMGSPPAGPERRRRSVSARRSTRGRRSTMASILTRTVRKASTGKRSCR
ncbi:MAG TPA: hypothetical protein PLR94_15650 [Accumulibacter sp.]|uniref:hypothetical protein n=1 Tax=Accumulibacter sp. TaxID=2053492 RepID=UPI002878AF9E|nr:hypothetical protein [Accumulibacter sp.]MDS4055516.1 hypothetical protein [Accumulibacter sp.]HNE41464.1 hypothetical protein [Accumulibacter sp.]HNI52746.1 hypothetical protein [Accumulibacter sp.]HNK04777.1 hypothetical protein [Accumulibacter sp.]